MSNKLKTPWEFACDWYTVEKTWAYLQDRQPDGDVPSDVRSIEFAEWLTHQMRLSMARGVLHGRQQQTDIDNSNFAAEEAGGLEQRRDPEIFHRHANGRRDIQTHERSPGKCPHCGSKDLWDDNLAFGCRACKSFLGGN